MRKTILDSYHENRMYKLNTLKIKVRDQCNLQCRMCDHWRIGKQHDELTTGQIAELIAEAKSLGCRQLTLTGGEPTQRRDLETILNHASQLGIRTSLLTNGYATSSRRLKAFVNSGLTKISISIDYPGADRHDFIRGIPGAFRRSTDFIRNCAALRKEDNSLYEVSLATCILRDNLTTLDHMVVLANSLGVDAISFIRIDPHNDDGAMMAPTFEEHQNLQTTVFPKLKEMCNQYKIKFRTSGISESYGLDPDREANKLPCYFTWYNATISSNGDVYPCCDSIGVTAARFGNIKSHGLKTVFDSVEAAKKRLLMRERNLPQCKNCYWEHDFNSRVQKMADRNFGRPLSKTGGTQRADS